MAELPSGPITFLFTDIEGSTRLWEQHPREMEQALARHDSLAAARVLQYGGALLKNRGEGDSLFAVFEVASNAVIAACELQWALLTEPWPPEATLRTRMALHTGEAMVRGGDYYGPAVNRCARLRSAGHGGQVLLSLATVQKARDELPPEVNLKDLGRHRLKDLQQPEHVFQVVDPRLPEDFPPLRSLQAFAHNLPVQLTSFVGREREITEVLALLATNRILTLTGAGGCGKTRLALQTAASIVERYGDGVWLVELAALADPGLLLNTVAAALGVREEPGRSFRETLLDHLRPRSLLLVLDNCEHLLAACADLVVGLLRHCPDLSLIATSREGLGVPGETTFRVPSLSVPDLQQLPPVELLTEYEAIGLFADRAAAALPEFRVTETNARALVQVCHRLDGIPLAIELAAARVRALPVEQIAERLDDRFHLLTGGSLTALPRQQTLRALIDWSYILLSEQEQTALRCISIFAGGWTLEAAEAVCAEESIEKWRVLDLLIALVQKSLVSFEEQEGRGRYRLLETVRQYGRERLAESGQDAPVRRRHRDYFLMLAETIEPHLQGAQQGEWCARLESEHDNVRIALDYSAMEPGGRESGLRLAAALCRFWIIRGYLTEGRQWLATLLDTGTRTSPWWRAKALTVAGGLAYMQNDLAQAGALCEQSLALAREVDYPWCITVSLVIRGIYCQLCEQDYAAAAEMFDEALERSIVLEDPWLEALSLLGMAQLAFGGEDLDRAESLLGRSLALFRAIEDAWFVCFAITFDGMVAACRQNPSLATTRHTEGLSLSRQLGYKLGLAQNLEGLAAAALAMGDPVRGAELFGASDALRDAMGVPRDPVDCLVYDPALSALRGALDEGTYLAATARGRGMTIEAAIAYALGFCSTQLT